LANDPVLDPAGQETKKLESDGRLMHYSFEESSALFGQNGDMNINAKKLSDLPLALSMSAILRRHISVLAQQEMASLIGSSLIGRPL